MTTFAVGDDVFTAYAESGAYVWRSACARMAVGHAYAEAALWPCPARTEAAAWAASMSARRYFWAAVDGLAGRARHAALVTAMRAAVAERDRRRWAPAAESEARRTA